MRKLNKVLRVLTFSILVFTTNSLYAGFEKGNGGDGFYCPKGKKIFFLAEEIEAKPLWGMKLDYRDEFLSTVPFKLQIQRLTTVFPKLSKSFTEDIEWVKNHLILISNVKLVNLDDDLLAWVPDDCTLEQLAIQTSSDVFVIQLYWEMMQKWQQQLLITHEALHRSINKISNEQNIKLKNGQVVRLINTYLWRRSSEEMGQDELKKTIRSMTTVKFN